MMPDQIKVDGYNERGLIRLSSFTKPGVYYTVDLRHNHCTCPDNFYRGVQCKHIRTLRRLAKYPEVID